MPADVSQLEALGRQLRQAGTRLRREQTKVVKETIHRIAETASENAPVDTGDLRDSFVESVRGMTGTAEATSEHAPFVEFGTFKDAPQPYMAPAIEDATPQYVADSEAAAIRALSVGH